MKNVLITAFLVSHFAATAQQDPNPLYDSLKKAFISKRSELGKPIGPIIGKVIGVDGGSIQSADGKMELIIPAGALPGEKNISIQPVTNRCFGGAEDAYDCEPAGLQFQKPVQIIFNYSDSGNKEYDPMLQNINWQDKDGLWHEMEQVKRDTTNRTISGNISHFTQFAKKVSFRVSPPTGTVHLNKSQTEMLVTDLVPDKYGDIKTNRREVIDNFYDNEKFRWLVNGVENGDAVNGKISFKGFTSHGMLATYIAPALIPPVNPVKVTVEMDGPITLNNGITLGSVSASAYITVLGDQYHFTYIHIDEGDGCYFMVDSSSCIVNMEKTNVTISNIINYRPWSDWPNCDKCKWEWTNKETVKGLVEINGMASAMVTPPNDQSSVTKVNISLVPAMGNTPSAIEHCKGGNFTIPSRPMSADPKYINFDIDGDDLVIHYDGKTARNELVVERHNEKTMIYMYKLN